MEEEKKLAEMDVDVGNVEPVSVPEAPAVEESTAEVTEEAPVEAETATAEKAPAAETEAPAPAAPEAPAPAAPEAPARAVIKVDTSVMLGDDNDLLDVEMPIDIRNEDLDLMNRAIKSGKILYGTVVANSVSKGKVLVRLIWKTISVTIPAEDFLAYSDMRGIDGASNDEIVKRYRQKASRMQKAVVSFIPKGVAYNENGVPIAVGSRKEAMEKAQNTYFFGRNPVAKVGAMAKASVVSAGPRYIYVECLGVEASIGTGELSAFEYIEDAGKKYPVGTGLSVSISALDIDRENHKVNVSFSRALLERATTPIEPVSDWMLHTRFAACVISENREYYIAILTGYKIRALIPKEFVIGTNIIFERGDNVSFLCTGLDKKKNSLIGRAIKSD